MRVVVTGGSGGIGRVIVRQLVEAGFDVRNVDVKADPDRVAPWFHADLCERHQAVEAFQGAKAVVHFGEIPGVWGANSADEVYSRNTRAGSCVFQSAVDLGIERVIYASSCQVYGCWGDPMLDPVSLPVTEDAPIRPNNAYSLSKVANEMYARLLSEQDGLKVALLRFPMVWNPHWKFTVETARRFKNLRDPRDCMATYVGAPDVAQAVVRLLQQGYEGCEAFNVCAGDILTLVPTREYVENAHPTFPKLPDGFGEFDCPVDTSKLRERYGWSPTFSIPDLVRKTLAEHGE